MTSREKVLEVERQVRSMIEAGTDRLVFRCPFCGCESREENDILCCDEAAEVVNAVLDHIEHLERAEIVEQAMDRLASFQAKALMN